MHLLDPYIALVYLVILGVPYVFPTFLALLKKKTNRNQIALVNLLLGWTIVGWCVALTWAVEDEHSPPES